MAKRFTDSEKWKKPWFRGLPSAYKHLWNYILDTCDHAGIWYVDIELASFCIGEPVDTAKALELFQKQAMVLNGGSRWFVKDFPEFQYGQLNSNNNLHRSVIAILNKYDLPYMSAPAQPLPSPTAGAKDKDKEKEGVKAVKNNTKEIPESKRKEWFNKIWLAYPKERRHGKDVALRRFLKTVETVEDAKRCANALENYLKSNEDHQYLLRASKWFGEWEDHADDDTRNSQRVPAAEAGPGTDRPDPQGRIPTSVSNALSGSSTNSGFFRPNPPVGSNEAGGD